MDELTIKHLELIQSMVERQARNSFQLKAWTVTLVAVIFALIANQTDRRFFFMGVLLGVRFWGLDACYL